MRNIKRSMLALTALGLALAASPLVASAAIFKLGTTSLTTTTALKTTETAVAPTTTETTVATTDAGILPTSPFYFLDTTYDSLRLALTTDPVKEIELALAISEERAAETLAVATTGDVEAATTSMTELTKMMAIVDADVAKLETTAEIEAAAISIEQTLVSNKLVLEAAIAAPAIQEVATKADLIEAVETSNTSITKMVTTTETTAAKITTAPTTTGPLTCTVDAYESCLKTVGCTQDTSDVCFKACPSIDVPCAVPAAGKTCSKPDAACREACLAKLSTCSEDCLKATNCTDAQITTSTVQPLSPELIINAFKFQQVTSPTVK